MIFKSYQKIILTFYGVLFLSLFLIIWITYQQINFTRPLMFYALDVGQGDALLIRTPQNNVILIDGGPDNSVLYPLGSSLPFYDRDIDLIVLTHFDADHITGLVEVLNRYDVKNIMTTSAVSSSAVFRAWDYNLVKEKADIVMAENINFFKIEKDLTLQIIHPKSNFQDKKSNNNSIVFRLVYKNVSILLTGDLEKEEDLVDLYELKSTILKVGHHGAENANSQKFIEAVSPEFAVISVGKNNKFGHPHKATLDRLKSVSSKVLRTDLLGDVILATDGYLVWQVEK